MRNKLIVNIFRIYFVGILSIIIGLLSCDPFDCGGSYPDKYKLIDMDVNPFKYHFADTFGFCFEKFDYPNDTVSFKNFGINLTAVTETYFSMTDNSNLNFFFNRAYACSPAPPQSSERIVNFQIFCNKDFNETHPIGSDISDLFNVVIPLTFRPSAYKNCANKKELQNLDTFFMENPFSFEYIDLVLNSPPSKSDRYIFTINYNQDGVDVDNLEIELPIVLIKP